MPPKKKTNTTAKDAAAPARRSGRQVAKPEPEPPKESAKKTVTKKTSSASMGNSTSKEPANVDTKGKRKNTGNTGGVSAKKPKVVEPATSNNKTASAKSKPTKQEKSKKDVDTWFDTYASETDADMIDVTGITRLLDDLKIKIDGASIYVLFWKLGCESMGEISRVKWVAGMKSQGVSSESQLLKALPLWLKEAKPTAPPSDPFLRFYKFMFTFSKATPETKSVMLESAIAVLTFVLDPSTYDVKYDPEKVDPLPIEKQPFPHITPFLKFLQEKQPVKVINKDQWESFIPFNKAVKYNLDNYNPEGAWPGLFDRYVEYRKETENLDIGPKDGPDTES